MIHLVSMEIINLVLQICAMITGFWVIVPTLIQLCSSIWPRAILLHILICVTTVATAAAATTAVTAAAAAHRLTQCVSCSKLSERLTRESLLLRASLVASPIGFLAWSPGVGEGRPMDQLRV